MRTSSGKSSLALLSGLVYSEQYRVLLIDLDGQSSITSYFTNDIEAIKAKNIYNVLKKTQRIEDAIYKHSDNLDYICSIIDISSITTEFLQSDRSYKLLDAIEDWESPYDLIIVDAPPTILLECTLANSIADCCIIPFMLDEFNLLALDRQIEAMKIDQKIINRLMEIKIVINNFEENRSLNDKVLAELKNKHSDKLLDTVIHRSADLQKIIARESSKKISTLRIYNEIKSLCDEVYKYGYEVNQRRG